MIVRGVDFNLHVPYYIADFYTRPKLLHINGNIKNPRIRGCNPGQVACIRVNVERIAGRRKTISLYRFSILLGTNRQFVGQTVPVRIIGCRIMDEYLLVACPVNWGIEQYGGRVVTQP